MKTIKNVQDFWNRRPCNIRHSTKLVGTKEYFDEVEWRKYFVEPHIPVFAQFSRWRGKTVLEIGCGLGTDSINFARAGAKLTVVELSERSLELTKKRFEIEGLKAEFILGNAEDLSVLGLRRFDLIYSFGVLHHTPNPERAVLEISKHLGLDSQVRLMLYSRYCWKTLWIYLKYGWRENWKNLIARYSEAETGCPVTFVYSEEEIDRLMRRAGLRVITIYKDHIFPYRISDYVQYQYVINWYFRCLPKSWFNWLESKFGWHTMIVAE